MLRNLLFLMSPRSSTTRSGPTALPVFAIQRKVRRLMGRVNPQPVFILGNQKSGTTAIAALLGHYAGRTTTLDLHWLHHPQRVSLWQSGTLQFSGMVRSIPYAFASDLIKEPYLTFVFNDIITLFPRARIIFISRDPRDNIRSILNRLKLPGNQDTIDESQWLRLPRAWHEVIQNIRLGLQADSYVEALAKRWVYAQHVYLCNKERLLLCRYEDFKADKLGEIARLAQVLHWRQRQDIRHLLDHQFQPRGDRDCDLLRFFGRRNLAMIESICENTMKELGYWSDCKND